MPKRIDANQPEIVAAYRKLGCTVKPLHEVGQGFPDLAVGIPTWTGGHNALVEIKDGEKIPSKRRLTADEEIFHTTWRGPVIIVESVDDVVAHVQRVKNE